MKKMGVADFFSTNLKKVCAALTAAALMLPMCASGNYSSKMKTISAAGECNIDTTKEYQIISGFGGINYPMWISDLSSSQRATAFQNGDNQLGFTILRICVPPEKSQWAAEVATAKYAQEQGALVFASPWNPPSSISESGGGRSKNHVNRNNYAAYAKHLNDFYHYMKDNGVELYAISVQNEPDYAGEWTGWSSDETTEFLANYGDQIDCRVMSPETFQYTNKDYYTKILNNSKAFANTDLFATHFYGTQRSQMDFQQLENCGKQIWMTEVYVPNSEANSNNRWPEALQVAENMHNGLVVGNMSAYVWWYIRRNYGPMNEDGTISKRGYMMAQYSKYVRPGSVRIDATESPNSSLKISAYKDNGQIVVVAINSGYNAVSQTFKVNANISGVTGIRSSGNENLAKISGIQSQTNSFSAQLPGQSVSTFVLKCDGVAPSKTSDDFTTVDLSQPDEDGNYFYDKFEDGLGQWSGRSATVSVDKNNGIGGSGAMMVSSRTKSWNGGQRGLSTISFVPGKQYGFSAVMKLANDAEDETLKLTLQYTASTGETAYQQIVEKPALGGQYVKLENGSYTIPSGASDLVLVVETGSGTSDFYVDEIRAGVTFETVEETTTTTTAETTELIQTEQTQSEQSQTTAAVIADTLYGDLNRDGDVDLTDLTLLSIYLMQPDKSNIDLEAADVQYDGTVDIADLARMKQYVSKENIKLGK